VRCNVGGGDLQYGFHKIGVLTAVTSEATVSWDVTQCLVDLDHLPGGINFLLVPHSKVEIFKMKFSLGKRTLQPNFNIMLAPLSIKVTTAKLKHGDNHAHAIYVTLHIT
jgi:hypothetical protein